MASEPAVDISGYLVEDRREQKSADVVFAIHHEDGDGIDWNFPAAEILGIKVNEGCEDVISVRHTYAKQHGLLQHSAPRKGVTWLKKDSCTKSFPLSDEDKLQLANEMAEAQAKIDDLEAELVDIRKEYKSQIDIYQTALSKAAREFREGMTEPQSVECDVFQDWNTNEIIYITSDEMAEEVLRRPMTAEEKQPTLFDAPPAINTLKTSHRKNLEKDSNSVNTQIVEDCATCSQPDNREVFSTEVRHECLTCAYKNMSISMPPCNTCERNPNSNDKCTDDNWIWAGSNIQKQKTYVHDMTDIQ